MDTACNRVLSGAAAGGVDDAGESLRCRLCRWWRCEALDGLWGKLHQLQPKWTITATWLILPVVIRSSQRLSHACVSINIVLWNCERLIISVIVPLIISYYLDNRSNSRANTCVNTRPLEEWYLLDWNQLASAVFWWFIITLRIARLVRRQIIRVSALLTLDGSVLDYHGCDG